MASIKTPEGVLFEVHVDKGDVTGQTWHGEFRAKPILTFADQIRSDRIRRDLLGPGDGIDPEILARASILAELQVRITQAPEWWQGGLAHADTNLLQDIYAGALKVRDDHFEALTKQGEEDQAALRDRKALAKK